MEQENKLELICSECGKTIVFKRKSDYSRVKNHSGMCKHCRNKLEWRCQSKRRSEQRKLVQPHDFELTCSQCGEIVHFHRKRNFTIAKNRECLCKKCRYELLLKKKREQRKLVQPHDFELTCSQCGETVHFKRLCDYTRAKNNGYICKECKNKRYQKSYLIKICTACGKEYIGNARRKFCSDCAGKMATHKFRYDYKQQAMVPRYTQAEYEQKIKSGEIKNAMLGKSFYDVWVEKYGKEEADELMKQWKNNCHAKWNALSEEEKKRQNKKKGRSGQQNAMYGRSVYDVWLEKYGKEEADRRYAEMRRKKSAQSSGKNNSMYGKPAPKGSGNGISGWYKGWYFRSLRELSYMVNVIEKEGHKWRSLDNTSDFRIKYLDKDGHERSYCPDFLIDDNIIVEIKPKKLQELDLVVRKQNAAIMYCKSRNMGHIITDVEIMDFSLIASMIENGEIRLTEKSFVKFKKYQEKHQRRTRHANQ